MLFIVSCLGCVIGWPGAQRVTPCDRLPGRTIGSQLLAPLRKAYPPEHLAVSSPPQASGQSGAASSARRILSASLLEYVSPRSGNDTGSESKLRQHVIEWLPPCRRPPGREFFETGKPASQADRDIKICFLVFVWVL